MIHVCFSLYDKTGHFSKFVGTAMLSLFENTNSEVTVHILHDNSLTPDSRDKFIYIANQFKQLVKFYNVAELCTEKIQKINTLLSRAVQMRFSIAAYYRFFIPNVLPIDIDKIIYLDADIIVNLDINELWQKNLGENVLGVVPISSQFLNVPDGDGFNAGVLLINVPAFRNAEETLNNAIDFMSKHLEYEGTDQDILNHCFAKQALKLPVKFNRLVKWSRHYQETQINKMIYHFNSHESTKGLGTDMNDPFNRLWMSYFIRTPFFDVDSIGRLCEYFRKIHNDLRTGKLRFYKATLRKTRAFFVEPDKIESIKKVFSIRNKELIIPAENEDSLQKLLDAMKNLKGKYIFFIMSKTFLDKRFPFDRLKSEGFVKGKDFLTGWHYLSEANGGYINTNPYIQVL